MNHSAQRPPRPFFWLTLILASWLIIEAFSFLGLAIVNRSLWPFSSVIDAMTSIGALRLDDSSLSARTDLKWDDYVEVLHPYFGYVADPTANRPFWQVSDQGFVFGKDAPVITKRSGDRLIVALFGGSFSNGLYARLRVLLESKAAELDKRVEVLNFSSAGYKQPQHLMVLNYMMALGAEFDIVINVDGFNDVTLALAENVPQQVNPFFPRGWDRRTVDTLTQIDVRRIGYVEYLKEQRFDWSATFLRRNLQFSPTFCLIWQYRDRALTQALSHAERLQSEHRGAAKSYVMRGPGYAYGNGEQLFEDLADVWRNCSAQMRDLCAAKGTRYLHFLQPNQYVPDSKPMGGEETARSITEGHPYQRGVLLGYPRLLRAGRELQAGGVEFAELTHIFESVQQPVYVDNCCHVNGAGYDIVAARIYEEIRR